MVNSVCAVVQGVSVSFSDGTVSCKDFCAYHSSFRYKTTGVVVTYAVILDLGFDSPCFGICGPGTPLDGLQIGTSHELFETITNPDGYGVRRPALFLYESRLYTLIPRSCRCSGTIRTMRSLQTFATMPRGSLFLETRDPTSFPSERLFPSKRVAVLRVVPVICVLSSGSGRMWQSRACCHRTTPQARHQARHLL